MGDPTVDLRIFISSVFRPVLIHDVNIGVRGDLLSNKLQNGFRRGHFPRHHQVSDQETSFSNSFGIGLKIPYLSVHLFKNLSYNLWVVWSIGELF
jgi:hypothetical protein